MKKGEYYNFVFHYGVKTYCFIKAKERYFISNPDRIIISPQTQIVHVQPGKKGEMKFSSQANEVYLRIDLLPKEEIETFIYDINKTFTNSSTWNFSKQLDSSPIITIINLKGFSASLRKVASSVTVSVIPDDLPLEKQKEYGTKNNGRDIQVIEYFSKKGAKDNFKNIVEKAVSQI